MSSNFIVEANKDLFQSWCKDGFQFAGHYDFTIGSQVDWVKTNCKQQFGLDIGDSEIEELCRLKLIDYFDNKKRERFFPPFVPDRIDFIKKVRSKFNFPITRLQQIVAYEDFLIRAIETDGELCYKETSKILDWYIKRITTNLKVDKCTVKNSEKEIKDGKESTGAWIEKLKKQIEIAEKILAFVHNKKWEELPVHTQERIKEWSFGIQYFDEMMRINGISSYNNQILQGYSPQVEFSRYSLDKNNLNFEDINWDYTFKTINGFDYIDFFRTPNFILEINNNVVDIKILNTQEVDAATMRIIDKIYTIFRERLGRKRKAWGENSGKKIAIQQRDENLRKLYAQLRNDKPNVASWRLLETLEEYSKKIGLPISAERIKRIIYCSKNMSKTPANISP